MAIAADHEVIHYPDVDPVKDALQLLGKAEVIGAWADVAGRVGMTSELLRGSVEASL